MRLAYLDCFSGISGDMFLGALVDAGVSPALLEQTVAALNIGARLEVSRVQRSGIGATKVDVVVGGKKDMPREQYWSEREREEKHAHKTGHDQAPQPHSHAHPHGRALSDIHAIIARAPISQGAQRTACAVFQALGEAEAKIHDTDIEKIHFHEVGAIDAMADIVCAAVGAEALAVDQWICSPLNVGGGTVVCSHGRFPIPAPATLELLKGAPVYSSGIELELVTPTGAAIAKTLVARFAAFPAMKVAAVGYGAGSRDLPGSPNVLRLTLGESAEAAEHATPETVSVLEANLDDLSPQVVGYALERLLAEGALDVFAVPVQMKKNRPGTLLTVLARPEDAPRLSRLLFTETSTLGIRVREERRQVLARRSVAVTTPWGEVQIKVANLNGAVANFAPEYEDCRRLAAQHHVPLKNVMQEAIRVYLDQKNG